MNTYKPLLTNQELKTLCKSTLKLANTPLQQVRYAHQIISRLKRKYKPKKSTIE